ncbi:tetratricopeptide repeat protein [bacterium]|nr:tetratricopeptide repeat protein [bacterium]
MKQLILLAFFMTNPILYAQSPNMDDLQQELKKARTANQKIDALNTISTAYLRVNLDSCRSYTKKALQLSIEIEYKAGEAECLWMRGKLLIYQGRFEEGVNIFNQSHKIFHSIGDAAGAAKAMDEAAYCLLMIEEYERAETLLDSAMAIAESIQDTLRMVHIVMNRSSICLYTGRFEEALAGNHLSYDLAVAIDYVKFQINGLMNLGNFFLGRNEYDLSLDYFNRAVDLIETRGGKLTQLHYSYLNIGSIFIMKNDPAKALDFGMKGLEICEQIHLKHGLMENYNLLAQACLGLREYPNAITWADKALIIAKEINIPTMIAQCNYNLGQAYSKSGRPERSLVYLDRSLVHFESLGNKFLLEKNLNDLALTHEALGNYRRAFEYQKQHDVLQDTLYSDRNKKIISELETEYQVKKKEAKLQLQSSQLSRQRNLNLAIAIVAVLLMIITVLTYFTVRKSRHINRKLQALDDAKNRFFSNITHEMRNPLTLIMAPLQNLTEKTKSGPYHAELKLAYSNSKKLLERVNEILDLSKLESGKIALKEKPVRLHDLCKRILVAYHSIAHYRKINVEFNYHLDDNLAVLMDIEKFEKILNNLILNAFKYSHTNGTVSLTIGRHNDSYQFAVQDSGQGIHPEDLPKIFNRYYQTEQAGAPARGGSGIGLTLAREYAKLFSGDIAVETTIGKGSLFTLSIPLTESDEALVQPEALTLKDEATSNGDQPLYTPILIDGEKPRLLIVEDDLEMSCYLKDILSPTYSSTTAPDGKAALDLLSDNPFDIIISDVMMPNMDGFEFREKVREHRCWIKTPFVMLTARSLERDKIKGLQLGIDDYITKPFNSKELYARLNNLTLNKQERDRYNLENPEESRKPSADEALLRKAEYFVIKNIDDSEFTIDKLADHMSYSVRQLERLLKKQSGLTPNAFIREIRLQKAYQILEQRQFMSIKEVCYEVGMNNPAYFSSKFKERFGSSPSEVLDMQKLFD